MDTALQNVVKVFLKSTKGKGNLGKKEFQNLVSSQLSNMLTETDSKDAIDNMKKGLDPDQDGKVGFEEYMKLVGYLACSLSKQRVLDKETSANNTATAQEPQSPAENNGEKAEANAEPKEEVKSDAAAEAAKVNAEPKVDVKVEEKANGEAKVEAEAAAATEAEQKEADKAEETAMVEPAAEEKPAAAKEDVEKKTDEEAS